MFYLEEKSNVKFLKSDILENENLVHAFTTRIGGNTPAPLDSFSLGTAGMAEYQEQVNKNRQTICDVLNLDFNKIINPEQKHTDNIKIVKSVSDDVSNTDGVITSTKNLVLMLLFADCTPIILYAPKEQVVSVVHAGWRGTAKKIAVKAINLFKHEFNIEPSAIKAAIGPAIGQCCYPVSSDTYIELKNSINFDCDNIFTNKSNSDKIRVDLKLLNRQQLIESGVRDVDVLDDCTSCKNSLYYSYRAENGVTGRHAAIASLR